MHPSCLNEYASSLCVPLKSSVWEGSQKSNGSKCVNLLFTIWSLCVLGRHFVAVPVGLQGAVEARNRDYANIVRSLNFVSKGWYDTQVMSDDDADTRRKVSHTMVPDSSLGST